MAHVQPTHPLAPMVTADDMVEPLPRDDNESWADTFLIAGLVVALSVLVFLLTG